MLSQQIAMKRIVRIFEAGLRTTIATLHDWQGRRKDDARGEQRAEQGKVIARATLTRGKLTIGRTQ